MIERINKWNKNNEGISEWMRVRTNEWEKDQMNEWMNEWGNEQFN